MELDGYCFMFGLMIVPFSFLAFPRLFFNKKLVIPLYVFAWILAFIGLTAYNNTDSTGPNFYLFLLCPIYSLALLRVELFIFKKKLKRNPKNPPRNISMEYDGIGWDRLFYFTFMFLSLCVPVFLLAYFHG